MKRKIRLHQIEFMPMWSIGFIIVYDHRTLVIGLPFIGILIDFN
jgi:hypothetical protein